MALDIFYDIGWVHEAYDKGGIVEINALYQANEITVDVRDAFRDIDSGDPQRISRGAEAIAEREQVVVLNDGYTKINNLISWRTFGMLKNQISNGASGAIPRARPFAKLAPNGSFTDTNLNARQNHRWLYVQYVLKIWTSMTGAERDKVVQTALGGLP